MFTNNLRFTGMSGMDITGMVNQIMRAESVRYDRMNLRRTRLAWQQEAMHGVIQSLQGFQNTFLNVLNPATNMRSPSQFSGFQSNVSISGMPTTSINVTGGAQTQPGTFRMRINNMASAETFSFGSPNMPSALSGNFSRGHFAGGDSFNIRMDNGATHEITFSAAEANILNTGSNEDIENLLNRRLADIYGEAPGSTSGVPLSRFANFRLDADQLSLVTDTGHTATLSRGSSRGNHTGSFNLTGIFTGSINEEELNNLVGEGFSVRMSDGTVRNVTVNTAGITTANGLASALNRGLSDAGISGLNFATVTSGGQTRMQLNFNGSEPLEILQSGGGNGNALANLGIPGAATGDIRISDALTDMGFSHGQNSNLNLSRTISDVFGISGSGSFSIAGRLVSFNPNQTVQQFMDSIAATGVAKLEFSNYHSEFRLSAVQPGYENRLRLSSNTTNGTAFLNMVQAGDHTAARDASVSITNPGGISIDLVRATNTFSFDGMEITINHETPEEIIIVNTRDVETPMESVRNFIDAFNELFDEIRLAHTTPRATAPGTRRFIEPLTPEQRRGMSEQEIELWEREARIGLLNRNEILRNFNLLMREAITEPVHLPNGERISLSSIGITTTREGTLEIDEDRLREALTSRPDEVAQLFTINPTDLPSLGQSNVRERRPRIGISERINDVIQHNVAVPFGRLVEQAGTPNSTIQSVMLRQIVEMDDDIERVRQNLIRRENALFAQFARMESAITRSNSQMDMLWSMLAPQ